MGSSGLGLLETEETVPPKGAVLSYLLGSQTGRGPEDRMLGAFSTIPLACLSFHEKF